MGKLQVIQKKNSDRIVYSLYPPLDLVSSLGWGKGTELEFEVVNNTLVVRGM